MAYPSFSRCRTALGVSRRWPLNVPMSAISLEPPCRTPVLQRQSLQNGRSHRRAHTLCRQGLSVSLRETAIDSWQTTATTKPSETADQVFALPRVLEDVLPATLPSLSLSR